MAVTVVVLTLISCINFELSCKIIKTTKFLVHCTISSTSLLQRWFMFYFKWHIYCDVILVYVYLQNCIFEIEDWFLYRIGYNPQLYNCFFVIMH